MSKYDALGAYLHKQSFSEVPMTFAEIETVTGTKLPPKAQHHRAWWSNNPSNNVMTKVWLNAGYETAQVDMEGRKLVFRRLKREKRKQSASNSSGLAEAHRMFSAKENTDKKPFRSPLWGALKGTFSIEMGWDFTKPALDPQDLAEMDTTLDTTADTIEQGFKGSK